MKGGIIRNLTKLGGNTRREWGDIQQKKNGIRLRLPLSKSGGGMADTEGLDAKYRERIESQKVAIRLELQRRDAREEEVRARAMPMGSAETERLEREEATRIEAERRYEAEEAERMESERRAVAEEACIAADAAQLKQRNKPPRRRRHRPKHRGGRPQ